MNEMIDRLARRLHKAHYERGRAIAPAYPTDKHEREMWEFSARAALMELRNPTSDIYGAVIEHGVMSSGGATHVWEGMIDAMLE